MPDALNYRVGSHPECPFKCQMHQSTESDSSQGMSVPDMLNNREGPQAREPSKVLNGQSYRERLVEEAFCLPAIRGSKKDSDRAITPGVDAVQVLAHIVPPGASQAKQ